MGASDDPTLVLTPDPARRRWRWALAGTRLGILDGALADVAPDAPAAQVQAAALAVLDHLPPELVGGPGPFRAVAWSPTEDGGWTTVVRAGPPG